MEEFPDDFNAKHFGPDQNKALKHQRLCVYNVITEQFKHKDDAQFRIDGVLSKENHLLLLKEVKARFPKLYYLFVNKHISDWEPYPKNGNQTFDWYCVRK